MITKDKHKLAIGCTEQKPVYEFRTEQKWDWPHSQSYNNVFSVYWKTIFEGQIFFIEQFIYIYELRCLIFPPPLECELDLMTCFQRI